MKNKLPIILLLSIITGLMLYYFLIVIPSNEQKLRHTGIQKMRTLAQNLTEKYTHYTTSLKSSPLRYFRNYYLDSSYLIDSIVNNENGSINSIYLEELKPSDGFDTMQCKPGPYKKSKDPFLNITTDDVGTCDELYLHKVSLNVIQAKDSPKRKVLNFSGTYENLTKNLKDYDFFDDIFLLQSSPCSKKVSTGNTTINLSAACDSLPGNPNMRVLDESRIGLSNYIVPDSLKKKGAGIYKDQIQGEAYYVFYYQKRFSDEVDISLVGLILESTYNAKSRHVSYWLLIFLSGVIMLLITFWPILKLFLLSKEERLHRRDVQWASFAFIFSVGLLTLMIITGFQFLATEKLQLKKSLKSLSHNISANFNKERNTILQLMDSIDAEKTSCISSSLIPAVGQFNDSAYTPFNEYIELDSSGNITSIITENDRYGEYDPGIPISSAHREYYTIFKGALENEKYTNLGVYNQSIKSRATGKLEIVFSKVDSSNKKIIVITASPTSVIEPIMPGNYTFAIIDKKGRVQFHSDTRKVQNENLFTECQDNTLKSYVLNGATEYLDLTYEDKHYAAYVQPLSNDWHIVVMYDHAALLTFAAMVFIFSFTCIVAFLFYIIVLHLIFGLDKTRYKIVKAKPFFFSWLSPLNIAPPDLFFLILLLFVFSVLNIYWLIAGSSITLTFLWYAISTTCCYFIIYHKLRKNKHIGITEAEGVFLTLILLGFVLIFMAIIDNNYDKIYTMILFFAIVICLLFFSTKKDRFFNALRVGLYNDKKNGTLNSKLKIMLSNLLFNRHYGLYQAFLLLLFLNIAILPSIKIFKDQLNHEHILRTRALLKQEIEDEQFKPRGDNYASNTDTSKIWEAKKKHVAWLQRSPDSLESEGPYFSRLDNYFYSGLIYYWGNDIVKYKGLATSQPNRLDSIFFIHDDKMVVAKVIDKPFKVKELFPSPNSFRRNGDRLITQPDQSSGNGKPPFLTFVSIILTVAIIMLFVWLLWRALLQIPEKIFYLPLSYTGARSSTIHALPSLTQPFTPLRNKENTPELQSRGNRIDEENDIIKIQDANVLLHLSYWHALPDEEITDQKFADKKVLINDEKSFLFDLAQDGIVNQGDRKVMAKLYYLGLIEIEPYLKIYSPSFANFILSEYDGSMLEKGQMSKIKKGRWNSWQLPLLIVIVALLFFLSIAAESYLAQISAVLGSVALILPRILTIASSIGDLKKPGAK
ncbi:MAG: hypothetical protein H7Y03_13140 [Chitinophagaceae bacterium]|nr:hypothetical protein [Chitinophagaceae bacterium]